MNIADWPIMAPKISAKKMSQALRDGAKTGIRQCRLAYVIHANEDDERVIECCASALIAHELTGTWPNDEIWHSNNLATFFDAEAVAWSQRDWSTWITTFEDGSTMYGILGEIVKRNDKGHTFEQIADWLESEGM